MNNRLHCPNGHAFKNVEIAEGAVRCPECHAVCFQFREADEQLTPKEFMALMDTRGVQCGKKLAGWMQGARPIRVASAGMMIAWMWPFLAGTFAEE